MQLDHIFLFVPSLSVAQKLIGDARLRANYSRVHRGQGTQNLCACLDDVFLELLWLDGTVVDEEAERITLGVRARGFGSPIGISWRGLSDLPCEPYAAPFLPQGRTIPVARASLDPALPFVFQTPGGIPPLDQTDGLVGDRQAPELTTLLHCEVRVPNPGPVSALLSGLQQISVTIGPHALRIKLSAADGTVGREFEWNGMDKA